MHQEGQKTFQRGAMTSDPHEELLVCMSQMLLCFQLDYFFVAHHSKQLMECQRFKVDTVDYSACLVWIIWTINQVFVNCHVFAIISQISTTIKYPDCQIASGVNDSDSQFCLRERVCVC